MGSINPILPKLAELSTFQTNVLLQSQFVKEEEASLVIAFSAVYNHLRDFMWVHNILEENKPINEEKISTSNGQHLGMKIFVYQNLISILHELFVLLEKNKEAIELPFTSFIMKMQTKDSKSEWQILFDIANNKIQRTKDEYSKITNCLIRIRNNIGFHFYTIKNYSIGFADYLKDEKSNPAIYSSFGNNLLSTRFYFADAAIEHRINDSLEKNEIDLDTLLESLKMYNRLARFYIETFIKSHDLLLNGSRRDRKMLQRKFESFKKNLSRTKK